MDKKHTRAKLLLYTKYKRSPRPRKKRKITAKRGSGFGFNVKRAEAKFFSDLDVERFVGPNVPIHKFNDLLHFRSLDEAAPYGACVLLFETALPGANGHSGHWVCFFRVNSHTWEWFDSYGIRPGSERDFVKPAIAKQLQENLPVIETLVANAPNNQRMIYNQVRLQRMAKGVDTCGRWVVVRLALSHLPLKKFQEMFVHNGDLKVTQLTS